jgi:NAD(P)-dependent dehydrogenase (short-subunit alcohol dehydrogenase family)
MKSFAGKVAVITGAASGIGRALAEELAAHRAILALSDIDTEGLAETVRRCERAGAQVLRTELDVSDRAAVYRHAEQVEAELGGANLVVNNAGVALSASVAEMSWDDLEWIVGINFWGVVHGTKAFLPQLIASGDGHVVNLSSVFGLIGVPNQSAYNATKFAVRGFTEALRQEMKLAGHPVGVSCVHPGGIKTNIARNARAAAGLDQKALAEGFDKIAMTTPRAAARRIVRGIRRNEARILIGPDAYGIDLLPRVLGSGYQQVVSRAVGQRSPAARASSSARSSVRNRRST